MYTTVHNNIIDNRKWENPNVPLTDRWNKQNVVYPHTGVLFVNKENQYHYMDNICELWKH